MSDMQQQISAQIQQLSERQRTISIGILGLWGYNDYTPPIKQKSAADGTVAQITSCSVSKDVSAVLPSQEDEMLKYKGKAVKKRADGRYWARYYDKQGKQHSVYGKTQRECYNKLKQAIKQVESGVLPTVKSFTLGEWLRKWAEVYKRPKQRDSTYKKTLEGIKALEPLHKVRLKDLTTLMIQELLVAIPYDNKRGKVYDIINGALKKAYRCEYIRRNPCENVELKKHKQEEHIPLSVDEEKRFIQAAENEKGGILYLIMLYQGLRIGEARALLESDFDFENKTLNINKTFSANKLGDTKTYASERVLPLFKVTAEAVKKCGLWRYKNDKQVYDLWKRICEKAGIPTQKYTSHSLRVTFCTRCAEWNIALKTCQKWLGHADAHITIKIYTKVRQEFEQKESDKIDTYFDTYYD